METAAVATVRFWLVDRLLWCSGVVEREVGRAVRPRLCDHVGATKAVEVMMICRSGTKLIGKASLRREDCLEHDNLDTGGSTTVQL